MRSFHGFYECLQSEEFYFKEERVPENPRKKGATIGANATVVCGYTIGQYALIGAGTVVTKDVPDYALVYGNPGKVKGWVCQCAVQISFQGRESQMPGLRETV